MGTEVITYSRIGTEDLNLGTGTFEVVLADGRKVLLSQVDLGAILSQASLSTQNLVLAGYVRITDSSGNVLHAFGSAS